MFDWIFHKAELLTTVDGKRYQAAMARLDAAGLPFRTKRSSPADPARPEPVGERLAGNTQYYIYVRDRDLDEAAYLLREIQR